MTIADHIIEYYRNIKKPDTLPKEVELLYPFDDRKVDRAISSFYGKFFNDKNKRTLLIGINPGRFGGGVTGIPFTDPEKLDEVLGIPNDFEKRYELSSQFVYEMISHLGGPERFYGNYLITSVCPLGFIRDGKNMNYYDEKELQTMLEGYMVENLKWHFKNVAKDDKVYSLGQGKNIKYLEYLNKKYQLFGEVIALPHPRWILQYRRKRKDEFLDLYLQRLESGS